MPRARVICIGNPYHPADWVGPAVFAALGRIGAGADAEVEVVDGGLQGLNLLRLLDGMERVVFADTLVGDDDDAAFAILEDPVAGHPALSFDHAGGLAYLLQAAPLVQEKLPRIWVVGVAAGADRSLAGPIARRCLELARGDAREA